MRSEEKEKLKSWQNLQELGMSSKTYDSCFKDEE